MLPAEVEVTHFYGTHHSLNQRLRFSNLLNLWTKISGFVKHVICIFMETWHLCKKKRQKFLHFGFWSLLYDSKPGLVSRHYPNAIFRPFFCVEFRRTGLEDLEFGPESHKKTMIAVALNPDRCCLSWTWCRWRGWAPPAPASTSWPRQGWKKTRLKKKTSPVVFLGFLVFSVFLYICPEERIFRVFSVSRTLLGASRH